MQWHVILYHPIEVSRGRSEHNIRTRHGRVGIPFHGQTGKPHHRGFVGRVSIFLPVQPSNRVRDNRFDRPRMLGTGLGRAFQIVTLQFPQ